MCGISRVEALLPLHHSTSKLARGDRRLALGHLASRLLVSMPLETKETSVGIGSLYHGHRNIVEFEIFFLEAVIPSM